MTDVRLTGSHLNGRTTPLSDWDFDITTHDFPAVAAELADRAAVLAPLAQFWDPFSERENYILLLRGPLKVDLIFPAVRRRPDPPWTVDSETLPRIDAHFWDWTLWLGSKVLRGEEALIAGELAKMHTHLLGALSIEHAPRSVQQAVDGYLERREQLEDKYGLRLPRELGLQVCRALRENGVLAPT